MKGKGLHMLAWILVIIGGLNWLLIGVFSWGIADIFGGSISRVVYILVGLSALYELFTHKGNCRLCGTQQGGGMM